MKWGKYQVLTKRHVVGILSLVFLAAVLVVVLAALIPYAYANATAAANKQLPIHCTDRSNKVVSLTFDTVQGDEHTAKLIEVCAQQQVTTTFFMTGEWVDRYPDSVKALSDAGHEIMNCSNTFPHMPTLSRDKMIAQINTCNDKIQAITGVRPTLFRAPYGDYDNALMETLGTLKMQGIQWDVDSFDSKSLTTDGIVQRVTTQAASGSIVLFHSECKNTVEALPAIIEKLKSQGYTFIPVSKMVYTEDFTINHEGRQISRSKAGS